ncbi:universal stress protein [Mycolicibacterium stellerae]|uniref:universal stress protein n=1 Tax=Mycolicibacterium stellerae TaxID=2358193 RepID=UPI000F0B7735|nr:universal stress protein [Mycolicibacterium stellerae]
MSGTSTGYGIVVGVDGSPESEAAVRWAADEAVTRHAQITLMHIIAPVVVTWPVRYLQSSYTEWQEGNAKYVIEQAQKTLRAVIGDNPPLTVQPEVRHDSVVPGLVKASREADMVVVGCRGLGPVGGALLGSTSRGLVHHGRCPVVVTHADGLRVPDRALPVLLGIDGSPASEGATALAFDEASRRGVDLIALHAWSDVGVFPVLGADWHEYEQEGHELLAERLAGWQEQYPDVHVWRRIVCDRPARWLIDEAKKAQLVVLGSRGRGGFTDMLLGSVSTAVAESARPPVIVVRD